MIYTSDHAAERFVQRGGFSIETKQAKIVISNAIAKWEQAFRHFGGGTVAIPNTRLKAVVVESDEGDLVVATVTIRDAENFDNKSVQLGKIKNRRNK